MVEDAEKSMVFYRDVLGLPADPLPELPMPDGSVMHRLNAGTSVIKVRQHAEPPPAKAAPGMPRDAASAFFEFQSKGRWFRFYQDRLRTANRNHVCRN